jgi:hypothetical protein
MLQSGDLEFRAAPTAWGCRARTTRPTGHDTVTLCLYSAKGQGSLSVFVRTTRSAGECQSPMGKPQAVGGECAPDNPPQPVTVRGSPRTTFPSPVKGRNRGSLQQDACSLALLPDACLLGERGNKKPEMSDVRRSYSFGFSDCSSASRRAEVICSGVSCEVSL